MRSLALLLVIAAPAFAQDAGVPDVASVELLGGHVTFTGAAEVNYQWNFNRPADNVTALRGFDNRHNTFTVSNVVLGAAWDIKGVIGQVTLQVGHTPSTYYAAEPTVPGGLGTNLSGPELWKYVQQARVGYVIPVWRGLTVDAGIFLSPIGPESMLVKDNWNWSRSNLFYGLPYYHAGLRASLPVSDRWTLLVAGLNGWNDIVDNNADKSVLVQATCALPEKLALTFQYLGGVERATGAPEGRAWRHMLDAYATWTALPSLAFIVQLNAGLEPNRFGLSHWQAAALSTRVTVFDWLLLAARADVFFEHVPTGASAIFWPASFMSSQTLTVDVRPHPNLSARLEYRHDEAGGAVFSTARGPFTSPRQNTLTLGVTSWF